VCDKEVEPKGPKYYFSEAVLEKLRDKHDVTEQEVKQCFNNLTTRTLVDDREEHKTSPDTRWFIAQTRVGRELKVCFMVISRVIHIKTAYDPNAKEKATYNNFTNNS
jgi:uncharacterized protein HemY